MNTRRMSWLSWAFAGLGVVMLAATVWFIGPFVTVGRMRPLEAAASRGVVLALLALATAAALWRRRLPVGAEASAAESDAAFIERAVAAAVLRLAASGPAVGLAQRVRNAVAGPPPQARLYDRPWILALGTPDSDQSRVLRAARLMPAVGASQTVPLGWAIGATHLLFDAGGDLFDGGPAWAALLAQLRRARPLRPLNAVLAAVSAGELVGPPGALATLAQGLAARRSELAAALGPGLPFLLVVTHCERIDGFPGPAAKQRLDEALAAVDLQPAPDAVCFCGDDPSVLDAFFRAAVVGRARAVPIDTEAVARLRRRMMTAYAALPLVAVGMVLAMNSIRQRNLELVASMPADVQTKAAALDAAQQRAVAGALPDLAQFKLLSELRDVGVLPPDAADGLDAGLGQRTKLRAAVELHYRRQLDGVLARRLASAVATELRQADPTQPQRRYLLLRAYVELADSNAVGSPATTGVLFDLVRRPLGDLSPSDREAVLAHLRACVQGCDRDALTIDKDLVDRTRLALATLPLEDRLYSQVLAESSTADDQVSDFSIARREVASTYAGLTEDGPVARAYTRDGYRGLIGLPIAELDRRDVDASDAVLGVTRGDGVDLPALRRTVLRRYAEAYVAAWDRYLAGLRIEPGTAGIALRSNPKPVTSLLTAVAAETQPSVTTNMAPGAPEERIVADHFAALRQAVTGSPSPAEAVLARWASLNGAGAVTAATELEAQAALLPEPLRSLQVQMARAAGSRGVSQPDSAQQATPSLRRVTVLPIGAIESGTDVLPGAGAARFGALGDVWFLMAALNPTRTTNLLFELQWPGTAVVVNASAAAQSTDGAIDGAAARRLFRYGRWDAVLVSHGLWRLVATLSDAKQPMIAASKAGKAELSAPALRALEQQLRNDVRTLVQARDASPNAGAPIVLHTYDYATPRPASAGLGIGPWLQPAMAAAGVPAAQQAALSRRLFDELARMLGAIAQDSKQYPNVSVVDTRGTLVAAAPESTAESGDWLTELAPTRAGYAKLAARWSNAMASRIEAPTASPKQGRATPSTAAVEAAKKSIVESIRATKR